MATDLGQLAFDVGEVDEVQSQPAAQASLDPQPVCDSSAVGSLGTLAVAADRAENGVPRSRALLQLAEAVEVALIAAIADAYVTRPSWRKLSADLGIPFQTLHRRYAATVER